MRRSSKFGNLILLVGGYGAGQGSIFLAQTWLIATSRLDLVAFFGLHFTMVTLGTIIVDAGSTTILARHVASIEASEPGSSEIWGWYSSITALRLLVAGLVSVCAYIASSSGYFNEATVHFVIASVPAFLIWAFNLSGLLDGLRRSGLSGTSAALPSLVCAGALIIAAHTDGADIGYYVGTGLSLGYLCAVVLQLAFAASVGRQPTFVPPSKEFLRQAAVDGFSYLGATLPGQLYFRFQLQLCSAVLGVDATAIFMYIKQFFIAIAQFIGFVRRIEFPNLVVEVAKDAYNRLALILKIQRAGTILSVVLTVLLAIAGILSSLFAPKIFQQVGTIAALFSPVVALNSLALALNQGLAAQGSFRAMMATNVFAISLGALICTLLVGPLGVSGLLVADGIVDLAGVLTIVLLLTFRKRN